MFHVKLFPDQAIDQPSTDYAHLRHAYQRFIKLKTFVAWGCFNLIIVWHKNLYGK